MSKEGPKIIGTMQWHPKNHIQTLIRSVGLPNLGSKETSHFLRNFPHETHPSDATRFGFPSKLPNFCGLQRRHVQVTVKGRAESFPRGRKKAHRSRGGPCILIRWIQTEGFLLKLGHLPWGQAVESET